MTRVRAGAVLGAVPPAVLVLTGAVAVQVGAGLAARLFSQVPPAAVTGLRLWTAAALLTVAGARGLSRALTDVLHRRAWRDVGVAVAFGLTLAVMNFSIYQAFARIPLGIAVTVEFLGPLTVAVAASRRALDVAWVVLAGLGVALLAHGAPPEAAAHPAPGLNSAGLSSASLNHASLNLAGLLFALTAAAAWAVYIMLSAATGRRFPGSSGLTIAMVIAALAVTPAGVAAGGRALLRPGVLGTGLAIGLLSSIIPYSLELEALRRIPPKVFGIWMSLDPAVAALVGLVLLGQSPAARDWAAICCVTAASAGAAWTAR
ncbi:MAG TPA: EamA family transporter [Streptosporangiaceae bacterium]|nr:EamA family transporter [Streptosporangiaceae bacterium]